MPLNPAARPTDNKSTGNTKVEEHAMSVGSLTARLRGSLIGSAGTIVFGMEDGTVSIFGLVFGVAATTSSSVAVLIAGASGAAAAAVSMMAGAYLEAETSRDERAVGQARLETELSCEHSAIATLLSEKLAAAGLKPELSGALSRAVQQDRQAFTGLLLALEGAPATPLKPLQQALWMLAADFLSAAVPIVPFMLLSVAPARIVSAAITTLLLIALGVGRARIGERSIARTVLETVGMGVAAALAGVAIGVVIDRAFR
jgi:vacuolar iron transporter family protein